MNIWFIMLRKFKQWRLTIPPISTKRTIKSHLKSLTTKRTTTYDVRNPNSGMEQEQKSGWVKPFNGISTSPLFVYVYPSMNLHWIGNSVMLFLIHFEYLLVGHRHKWTQVPSPRKEVLHVYSETGELFMLVDTEYRLTI